MKQILIYILVFISNSLFGNTYYVSNTGSNAANGTSSGTSWQTIAYVNSRTFSPGDQILFKKGDTWNEKLMPPSSGSSGSPVIFGSYGTGVKPVITGLQSLTGWVNVGGNIWQATATNSVLYQNTVVINGVITAKGRYPNSTFLTSSDATNTQSQITGALPGSTNFTGDEAVVRTADWSWDVSKILSQSNGTLTFSTALTYEAPNCALTYVAANCKYFIQNSLLVLDVQNEWCYDSTTKVISVYSSDSPTNVQYCSVDSLVTIWNKSYITFDGLNFQGGNRVGIRFDTCNNIVIQNCTFRNMGKTALYAHQATYCTIQNNSLIDCQNNGSFLNQGSNYDTIRNNIVKNSGMLVGMGANANGGYIGILMEGVSSSVINNVIDSSGYCGIYFTQAGMLIKNNLISNYCYNKNDGGGIYTCCVANTGSYVTSNIILNGLGGVAGGYLNQSPGLYLDGNTNYGTWDSNTVYSALQEGVLFNYPSNITFRFNTIVNDIGHGFWYPPGSLATNLTVTKNIFYSTDSFKYVMNLYYGQLFTGAVLDSNYYLRPIKEADKFWIGYNNTSYSLPGWITTTGYDAHSVSTPAGITSITGILLYNPTLSDSTFTISGSYINPKGTVFTNSVLIHPFQSELLFPTTTPDQSRTFQNFRFYKIN